MNHEGAKHTKKKKPSILRQLFSMCFIFGVLFLLLTVGIIKGKYLGYYYHLHKWNVEHTGDTVTYLSNTLRGSHFNAVSADYVWQTALQCIKQSKVCELVYKTNHLPQEIIFNTEPNIWIEVGNQFDCTEVDDSLVFSDCENVFQNEHFQPILIN